MTVRMGYSKTTAVAPEDTAVVDEECSAVESNNAATARQDCTVLVM